MTPLQIKFSNLDRLELTRANDLVSMLGEKFSMPLSQEQKDDLVAGLVPQSVKDELFAKVEVLLAAASNGQFSQADIDAAVAAAVAIAGPQAVAEYKAQLGPVLEAAVVSANDAEKAAILAAIV